MAEAGWSDWELDFLEHMSNRQDPLTTLQAEKLIQIRDDAQFFSTYDGFNISTLIERCWAARFDLSDNEDITFIEKLKESGSSSIRETARWSVVPLLPSVIDPWTSRVTAIPA